MIPSFAARLVRLTILQEPGADSGAPRSETNTNADFALWRWWRRNARNSRPVSGCLAGVPCLMRRTCRVAAVKSICSQRKSQTSAARSLCVSRPSEYPEHHALRCRRPGSVQGVFAGLASGVRTGAVVIQIRRTPIASVWPRYPWTFRLAARNGQLCRFRRISVTRLDESECGSNGYNRYRTDTGNRESVRRHGSFPTKKRLPLKTPLHLIISQCLQTGSTL